MPALTALPFSTLVFSTRGLPAFIGTTFGATHRLPPIIESRNARDYIPKFQAEFGVVREKARRLKTAGLFLCLCPRIGHELFLCLIFQT